jgi:hypothetical protein
MHKLLIALTLLGSCSSGGGAGANHSEEQSKAAPASAARPAVPESLVGLYEGDQSGAVSQICIVERGGESRFGLLIWGGNDHSCSGSGTVERDSGRIVLAMAGDSPCRLEAEFDGRQLSFAQEQPAGCAYYCGARAQMAGARLTQSGKTESDALRARDLVDEPLCSG